MKIALVIAVALLGLALLTLVIVLGKVLLGIAACSQAQEEARDDPPGSAPSPKA